MGQQITLEVEGGLHGMRCILRAGVMLECVRKMLTTVPQVRGTAGRMQKKPLSFDAWLAKFAPQVPSATAYRFIAISASIQESFKGLSPAAKAKAGGFAAFVTADPAKLPAKLQSKQLELWSFVDGTSQRSWLDMFKPKKPLGGRRERDPNKAADEPDTPEQAAIDLCKPLMADIAQEFLVRKTWSDLPDAMRRELRGLLYDAYKLIPE